MSNMNFLSAGLWDANYLGGETLAEIKSEDEEEFTGKSRFPGPDTGPGDVWRWAHQAQEMQYFIFSPAQIWDRARLGEWKMFDKPWEGADVAEY